MIDSDTLSARLTARMNTAQRMSGRLVGVGAGRLIARVPDAVVGQCYLIERQGEDLIAEVVGFNADEAILLPFDELTGVRPGANMRPTDLGSRAPSAASVLGEVIDPLGVSLYDGTVYACEGLPLRAPPPGPLARRKIEKQIATGLRVVDGFLPFGEGQRVGLFAGSGVGKSTLLGQLTRGTDADVCIVALVGERGREVGEFLEEALSEETRKKTTIVVATSDSPPMLRLRAAELATSLAEDWRDQGKHCLLLVDSLTRYARALREAALISGEPPARRGYPASVFAALPKLLERAGQGESGAISAVYTILVAGGDMEEPIADEVRGIVDGHWVLRRELAERGHYPALDVLSSVSRVIGRVAPPDVIAASREVRSLMATLHRQRDAIDLGIYQYGSQPEIDNAIDLEPEILEFLQQASDDLTPLEESRERLLDLAAQAEF